MDLKRLFKRYPELVLPIMLVLVIPITIYAYLRTKNKWNENRGLLTPKM